MCGTQHAVVRQWLRTTRRALLRGDISLPADADRTRRAAQARSVDKNSDRGFDRLRRVLHLAGAMVRLGRLAHTSTSDVFPNALVWRIGLRFPTLPVELFYLQAREVHAL